MLDKNVLEDEMKMKNQDDTDALKMKKESLDALFSSSEVKDKSLLYEEENRLAEGIDGTRQKQRDE